MSSNRLAGNSSHTSSKYMHNLRLSYLKSKQKQMSSKSMVRFEAIPKPLDNFIISKDIQVHVHVKNEQGG